MKKIALDVDDVLCKFTEHAHSYHGIKLKKCNYWCVDTMDVILGKGWFKALASEWTFWETLQPLSDPADIDFEVFCYISSFPEDMYHLRVNWLKQHGFPEAPLYIASNKLEKCLELGVDILVDDKPATIETLQKSPVKGIHFITPYAGFEPVGDYITNLNQVKNYL